MNRKGGFSLDDKLKDLEKIMDKTVYQKQRFTQRSKEEVLLMIKKRSRVRRKTLAIRYQYVMSVAVFTLVFGFLLGMIVGDVQREDRVLSDASITNDHPVASLPLINRTVQIMKRDTNVSHISVSKSNHHIYLSFEFPRTMSINQMKEQVNRFLEEGSALSSDVKMLKKQGKTNETVWNDYTLDIVVKKQSNYRINQQLLDVEEAHLLKGIKEKGSNNVHWLDGEPSPLS